MTKYTTTDLINLQNPYKDLLEDDNTLTENRDGLEQLDYADKINLVTKMILACPAEQLNIFSLRSEELRHHEELEDSFHNILNRGLEVRYRIDAIANPQNPYPQNNLLNNEFNADLFNEFPVLKNNLVEQKLTNLVINLVTKTPDEKINELNRNIQASLSETNLSPALREAFVLRRLLLTLVNLNPEQTFTSHDFNPGLFHKYPDLVTFYLAGHEVEIAQRLAESSDKAKISRSLEQLKPSAIDKANPLSKIYDNFQEMVSMYSAIQAMDSFFTEFKGIIPNPRADEEKTSSHSHSTHKISSNRHITFSFSKIKQDEEKQKDSTHASKCSPCAIV